MIVKHRWVRVALVLSVTILAVAVGLFTYRSVTTPKTLTVAVGSFDGDIAKLMTGIAGRRFRRPTKAMICPKERSEVHRQYPTKI